MVFIHRLLASWTVLAVLHTGTTTGELFADADSLTQAKQYHAAVQENGSGNVKSEHSADNANSVWVVTFESTSTKGNNDCSGGIGGESARIEKVFPSATCTARHGASAERIYYQLKVNGDGSGIETVSFDCKYSNCTDCLINTTSNLQFMDCTAYTPDSGAIQSISFRNTPNFLPSNSNAAPASGITMLAYNGCGDESPEELLFYDAVGTLTQNSDRCQPIGNNFYHNLHLSSNGKISGGWMCSSDACVECEVTLSNTNLEESIVTSDACYSTISSPKFNLTQGGQPPCQCNLDHVYVNTYASDSRCSLGMPFNTALVSRVIEGPSSFTDVVTGNKIYRDLQLEWDRASSSKYVKQYGTECDDTSKDCLEKINNPEWTKCYSTSDRSSSIALYEPDSVCYGSTNVNDDIDGLAVLSYFGVTPGACPEDLDDDPSAVLEIRTYATPNGTCAWDGNMNSPRNRFKLSQSQVGGGTTYSGGFNCTDITCTECSIVVTNWEAGLCYSTSFGSMQIGPTTSMVQKCESQQPITRSTSQSPDVRRSHNSPVIAIAACGAAGVITIGAIAFVLYMRKKNRSKYESLTGRRSRKNRPRAALPVARESTFYEGI